MSKVPRSIGIELAVAAGVVIVVVAVALLWIRTRENREHAGRLAKLETENRELRARSGQLAREAEALRQQLGAEAAQAAAAALSSREVKRPAGGVGESKALLQLRDSLAAANASIGELQVRNQGLEAAMDKMKEENERLAASEGDLKEKVAGMNRIIEAIETELKGKTNRLPQLETANQGLREENRKAAERISRLAQLTGELEEINRRREIYLANILRRYKDVTELYRALAARLENPREGPFSTAAEVSRIQNAISMTEEDLRSLSNLNAQAQRKSKTIDSFTQKPTGSVRR